jgi:23S rRNA pseudouridine1911/1915/1917 synthase
MAIRTFTTDRGDIGQRLDRVLRRHLPDLGVATRTRLQRWIVDGAVAVNGRCIVRSSRRIAAGDVVTVSVPRDAKPARRPMQAQPAELAVLYEDEHMLVLNKPAGIVVHPTHAHAAGTLMNALIWHARTWPAPQRPSIVGRLDKLTSGIVVVARTASMHAALQRAMAAPDCEKDYLAVVFGRVRPATGQIALRLARDAVDRRKMSTSERTGAASLTLYSRLARVAARPIGLALVRCSLVTGRTHQIRAHLAARGWPVVGDPVYGEPRWSRIDDAALAQALRTFSRQALHASRLALLHPITRVRVEVTAPVPADLRDLLNAAGLIEHVDPVSDGSSIAALSPEP